MFQGTSGSTPKVLEVYKHLFIKALHKKGKFKTISFKEIKNTEQCSR